MKSSIAKALGISSQSKNIWKNGKISLRTTIKILEATVVTVVKHDAVTWALRKAE